MAMRGGDPTPNPRDNLAQWDVRGTETQSVAGPDVTDQIAESVHEMAMKGGDPYPNPRDNLVQKGSKADPISPENYDDWVYKFSKENMGTFPQWHLAAQTGEDNVIGVKGI